MAGMNDKLARFGALTLTTCCNTMLLLEEEGTTTMRPLPPMADAVLHLLKLRRLLAVCYDAPTMDSSAFTEPRRRWDWVDPRSMRVLMADTCATSLEDETDGVIQHICETVLDERHEVVCWITDGLVVHAHSLSDWTTPFVCFSLLQSERLGCWISPHGTTISSMVALYDERSSKRGRLCGRIAICVALKGRSDSPLLVILDLNNSSCGAASNSGTTSRRMMRTPQCIAMTAGVVGFPVCLPSSGDVLFMKRMSSASQRTMQENEVDRGCSPMLLLANGNFQTEKPCEALSTFFSCNPQWKEVWQEPAFWCATYAAGTGEPMDRIGVLLKGGAGYLSVSTRSSAECKWQPLPNCVERSALSMLDVGREPFLVDAQRRMDGTLVGLRGGRSITGCYLFVLDHDASRVVYGLISEGVKQLGLLRPPDAIAALINI